MFVEPRHAHGLGLSLTISHGWPSALKPSEARQFARKITSAVVVGALIRSAQQAAACKITKKAIAKCAEKLGWPRAEG